MRLVRRHFPISEIHPRAYDLAFGGVRAERQGAFEAYYRAIFDQQRAINNPQWVGIVSVLEPLEIDLERFEDCLVVPNTAVAVDHDIAMGTGLGINGTPTFLINHRMYQGSRSVAALDSLIARTRE